MATFLELLLQLLVLSITINVCLIYRARQWEKYKKDVERIVAEREAAKHRTAPFTKTSY